MGLHDLDLKGLVGDVNLLQDVFCLAEDLHPLNLILVEYNSLVVEFIDRIDVTLPDGRRREKLVAVLRER